MPTPEQMAAGLAAKMAERTGRDFGEWVRLVVESGIEGEQAQRAWLRKEHGLTMPNAFAIVDSVSRRAGVRPPTLDETLAAQYAGAKAALRPIYDRIAAIVTAFGGDVDVQPRQTYISFVRRRQFATVAPATKTRVDLGLRLDGVPPEGRLEPAKSTGGGMTTHRVALAAAADVDAVVEQWLALAYDRAR